jgi:hypothetical protein
MAQELNIVDEKLADMDSGLAVEFDPDEAEEAGFFVETALEQEDALDAAFEAQGIISGRR